MQAVYAAHFPPLHSELAGQSEVVLQLAFDCAGVFAVKQAPATRPNSIAKEAALPKRNPRLELIAHDLIEGVQGRLRADAKARVHRNSSAATGSRA
jgi:hypothetical protein